MEEQQNQEKKRLLQSLKPKTRREWGRLVLNIVMMAFFLFVLFYALSAYREGYDLGIQRCIQNTSSHAIYNWTPNFTSIINSSVNQPYGGMYGYDILPSNCTQIECDCAKNTTTPCMLSCWQCN